MTETTAPESVVTAAPEGLLARLLGVLTSPRATYASIAARPRWLGALALTVMISGSAAALFLSTGVGRRAVVDQQITQMESLGRRPTQPQLDRIEQFAPYFKYIAVISQAVFLSLGAVVISGILFAIFTALLGGDATFGQLFSVVAHSGAVFALQQLFVLPLDYVRETLSSPTNLAVFLPMLDENTFLVRMFGAIDLFLIWWMVNLAIGVAVLYRRRTAPIASGFLAVYAMLALVIAAVKTAIAGA